MPLFGKGSIVNSLVNGITNIAMAPVNIATSALTNTIGAVMPAVKTVANSPAGAILANNVTGGGSTSALKGITQAMNEPQMAGRSEDTAKQDGITVPYSGWRRYLLCYKKVNELGYLVNKDGQIITDKSQSVLDYKHIVITAVCVLTFGIGVYYVGKSKRWW